MAKYLDAHFYKARTESLWKFVDQVGAISSARGGTLTRMGRRGGSGGYRTVARCLLSPGVAIHPLSF
ncbi:unnamed protein product [Ectocarpus sp. 6 AP-2014]